MRRPDRSRRCTALARAGAKARRRRTPSSSPTGAGNRFDLEQAQTNVNELTAQIAAARAAEQQVREKLSGRVNGDLAASRRSRRRSPRRRRRSKVSQAQVDTTRAQLENARWDLTQTTVVAPGNGTMVNVMLRPGFFVAGMPFNEVMTFVDNEYQIFALFGQNELHQVEPGNEAEITLDTYPGRIIKAHVDSIIWAQAQGQIEASGDLPKTTFVPPPGPVPGEARRRASTTTPLFLAAGARGAAAIYTEHLHARSHHPQGAAAGVVVSRLHHHQAQHQPRALRECDTRWARIVRSPPVASRIAVLVAAMAIAAGCALKTPPDAAAIKAAGAARGCRRPAQWTATARRRRQRRRQLARDVPRRSADGGGRRGDRPQRRPARRRGARRAGAALCQAGRREAVSVGRRARARRRQDVGRRLGPAGRAC